MNNKKLFKGALVLFASILMAVSCQSNSKPGDKENEETPGANKPTSLEFTFDTTTAKLEGKATADVVLTTKTTGTQMDTSKTVNIVFDGRDKEKIEAKVTKVTGVAQAEVGKSYTAINAVITGSDVGTTGEAVDLSNKFNGREDSDVVNGFFTYNNDTKGKTVITFTDEFAAASCKSSGGLAANNNGGVVIIELEIKGKADTDVAGLTAKKTIYVGVKRLS